MSLRALSSKLARLVTAGPLEIRDRLRDLIETVNWILDNLFKVKVSSDDTTAGWLEDKLDAGANITLTTINPGANEKVQIAGTAGTALHLWTPNKTVANPYSVGTHEIALSSFSIPGTGVVDAVFIELKIEMGSASHGSAGLGPTSSNMADLECNIHYGQTPIGFVCNQGLVRIQNGTSFFMSISSDDTLGGTPDVSVSMRALGWFEDVVAET